MYNSIFHTHVRIEDDLTIATLKSLTAENWRSNSVEFLLLNCSHFERANSKKWWKTELGEERTELQKKKRRKMSIKFTCSGIKGTLRRAMVVGTYSELVLALPWSMFFLECVLRHWHQWQIVPTHRTICFKHKNGVVSSSSLWRNWNNEIIIHWSKPFQVSLPWMLLLISNKPAMLLKRENKGIVSDFTSQVYVENHQAFFLHSSWNSLCSERNSCSKLIF